MGFLRCCVYYAFLGIASFVLGRLLPKSWFRGDSFPYRCASWEQKAPILLLRLFGFLRTPALLRGKQPLKPRAVVALNDEKRPVAE